jgi:RES domain-containing protein
VTIYRMHSPSYSVFDTSGAFLKPGRWHLAGTRIVYAAQHVSLAALETLVHAGGAPLPPRLITAIEMARSVAIEYAPWMELGDSQRFGSQWVREARTAVLAVPSIVVQRMEMNFVLNPAHPGFRGISHGPAQAFTFPARLFPARLFPARPFPARPAPR